MDLNRLQKKWDVYLLTHFFNNPGYKMNLTAYVFREKNNISEEEFKLLRRVPSLSFKQHRGADIYGFMARYLTNLYLYIDANDFDITDVFDIAQELSNSTIDTTKIPSKLTLNYKKEANKDSKRSEQLRKAQIALTEYTCGQAGQWHVCK